MIQGQNLFFVDSIRKVRFPEKNQNQQVKNPQQS